MLYSCYIYIDHVIEAEDRRDAEEYIQEIRDRLEEVLRTEFLSEATVDTETHVQVMLVNEWEES